MELRYPSQQTQPSSCSPSCPPRSALTRPRPASIFRRCALVVQLRHLPLRYPRALAVRPRAARLARETDTVVFQSSLAAAHSTSSSDFSLLVRAPWVIINSETTIFFNFSRRAAGSARARLVSAPLAEPGGAHMAAAHAAPASATADAQNLVYYTIELDHTCPTALFRRAGRARAGFHR